MLGSGDSKISASSVSSLPEVKVSTLSPDLERQRQKLKTYYQDNAILTRLFYKQATPLTETSYINLAIVEEQAQAEKEEELETNKAQSYDERTHSYEALHNTHYDKHIAPDKLFDKPGQHTDFPKKILILGWAGVGKTTLCKHIAHQWSVKGLWADRFDWLIHIPLRNLAKYFPVGKEYQPDSVFTEVLYQTYFSKIHPTLTREKTQVLYEQIFATPERILLLLDGYDEVAFYPHLKDIVEILLNVPYYILTSRPYFTRGLKADICYENIGFIDPDIKNYVQQFFATIPAPKKFQPYFDAIRQNHNLWEIAHIPINLELICSVFDEEKWTENEKNPLTLTALYEKMVNKLARRYLEKRSQNPLSEEKLRTMPKQEMEKHSQLALDFLSELAFAELQDKDSSILIKNSVIDFLVTSYNNKDRNILTDVLEAGFLKGTREKAEIEQDYYFIHLSFQEYFAAQYLVKKLVNAEESAHQFIQTHRDDLRYQAILRFVAGLLSSNPSPISSSKVASSLSLATFWNLLAPNSNVIGRNHLWIVTGCLEEAQCDAHIPNIQLLYANIQTWILAAVPVIPPTVNSSFLTEAKDSKERDPNVANQIKQIFWHRPYLLQQFAFVEFLINGLKKTDPEIQIICAELLGNIHHVQEDQKEKLLTALFEVSSTILYERYKVNSEVRNSAFKAFLHLGEKQFFKSEVKALSLRTLNTVHAVNESDENLKITAIRALGVIGRHEVTKEILNVLCNNLAGSISCQRVTALALQDIGEKAATPEVIDALVKTLQMTPHSDWVVKSPVIELLGQFGVKCGTEKVAQVLLGAFKEKDMLVQDAAARSLAYLIDKTAAVNILSDLYKTLMTDNDSEAETAAFALSYLKEPSICQSIVEFLLENLASKSELPIVRAAEVLEKMDERIATEDLIKTLLNIFQETKIVRLKVNVAKALGKLSKNILTEDVVSALEQALADPSDEVMVAAAKGLAFLGEKAANEKVIQRLSDLWHKNKDKRRSVIDNPEWEAFAQLAKINPTSVAVNTLITALVEGNYNFIPYSDSVPGILIQVSGKIDSKTLIEKLLQAADTHKQQEDEIVKVLCYLTLCLKEDATTEKVLDYLVTTITSSRKECDWEVADKIRELLKMSFHKSKWIDKFARIEVKLVVQILKGFLPDLVDIYLKDGADKLAFLIAKIAFSFANEDTYKDIVNQITTKILFTERANKLIENLSKAFIQQAKSNGLPEQVYEQYSKKPSQLLTLPSLKHKEIIKLQIPFEELKKTRDTIKHPATQTIINEFINIFEEKAIAFNEDAISPIVSPTSLREQVAEWRGLISTFTEKVEAAASDKSSERRALDIIKKIEECCQPIIQQLAEPLSPVSKPFAHWQEHRLRLEQHLLLNDSPLAKAFTKVLSEIDRLGSRNYTLPNGIFICYAWPDAQEERERHLKWIQPFLVGLRQHLRAAGLATAKLDIKDNPPGGNIYEYMKGAETADFVLLIGTESLLRKHEKGVSAICTELININRKREKDRKTGKYRVLPLLISGDYRDSFPAHYELYTTVKDWKGTKTYFQHLRWLIATLYSTREEAFTATWEEEFLKKISEEQRLILEQGLDEKTVLAKIEKEKVEQAKAKEQKKAAGDKLLDLDGDSEMKDVPSVSTQDYQLALQLQQEEFWGLTSLLPAIKEKRYAGFTYSQERPQLTGTLPNGSEITFEEFEAKSDGNCGFYVLGLKRPEVVALLESLATQTTTRQQLADEIINELKSNGLGLAATEKSKQLIAAYHTLLAEEEKLINEINAEIKKQEPFAERRGREKLVAYLRQASNLAYIPLLKRLEQWQVDDAKLNQDIQAYCASEEMYLSYVRHSLGKNGWLGYRSALLLAQQKHFNLYIWHKNATNSLRLNLTHFHQVSHNTATYHMLHTNRFTHFNLLAEVKQTLILSLQEEKEAKTEQPSPIISLESLDTLWVLDKTFVSRSHLVAAIRERFTQKASASTLTMPLVAKQPRLIVCQGLGGVGKTFVALEYLSRHSQDYTFCVWISATSKEKIQLGYKQLGIQRGFIDAATDKPLEVIVSIVKDKLATCAEKWLMILDDGENYEALRPFIPASNGNILITSRNSRWTEAMVLPIEVMTPVEAVQLVNSLADTTKSEPTKVEALVATLGHLPLALAQAASYIRTNGITVNAYLELYQDCRRQLLADESLMDEPGHKHDPVAITWRLNIGKIKSTTPHAIELLKIGAFLDSNNIPRELLAHSLCGNSSSEAKLHCNSGIKALQEYSLIKVFPETIAIHLLVQAVTAEACAPQEKEDLLKKMVLSLAEKYKYDRNTPDAVKSLQQLLPHVFTLISHTKSANIILKQLADLLHTTGVYYLDHEFKATEARKYLEEACRIKESLLGKKELSMADTYQQLSSAYAWDEKSYEHALRYAQQAFQIKGDFFGNSHKQMVGPLLVLANIYMKRKDGNDLESAREKVEAALKIVKNENSAEEAMAYHYLGNLSYENAKKAENAARSGASKEWGSNWIEQRKQESIKAYRDAQEYFKKSLCLKERLLGVEHFEVARTLHQLGSVHFQLFQFEEARKCQERALNIRTKFYGTKIRHDVVLLIHLLGETYIRLGKNKEADGLLRDCLQCKEKLYGKAHAEYEKTASLLKVNTTTRPITAFFKTTNENDGKDEKKGEHITQGPNGTLRKRSNQMAELGEAANLPKKPRVEKDKEANGNQAAEAAKDEPKTAQSMPAKAKEKVMDQDGKDGNDISRKRSGQQAELEEATQPKKKARSEENKATKEKVKEAAQSTHAGGASSDSIASQLVSQGMFSVANAANANASEATNMDLTEDIVASSSTPSAMP